MKVIEVRIKGGSTQVEPKEGFPDNSCLKDTHRLEEILGKVTARELKAEGYVEQGLADGLKAEG
jgi:hypothetical protein